MVERVQLLRKVVRVGTSKAIIIPCEFFESCEAKGKTFTEVKMHLNDKIIIEPVYIKKIKEPEV